MKKLWLTARKIMIIAAASLLYAFAFDWLFAPNNLVVGGATGLAQALHRLAPFLPVGVLVIVINVPLFALGVKKQGVRLLLSSALAMTLSSLFIDLLDWAVDFPPMEDHLVASIFGGALVGAACGILLMVGATTGGTELAARLLRYRLRHISIGRLCLILDLGVIVVYTLAYRCVTDGLYAAIAMYICSIAMDTVIYGRNTSKVACIICSDGAALKERLLALDLGVTGMRAFGGYSDEEKEILLCAIKPSRMGELKTAVAETDPTAFMLISNAEDVFGEGFSEMTLDSL